MYGNVYRPQMFWTNVGAMAAGLGVLLLAIAAVRVSCADCFGGGGSAVVLPAATPAAARVQQSAGAAVIRRVVQEVQSLGGETAVLGGVPGSNDPDVGGGSPGVILDLVAPAAAPAAVAPQMYDGFTDQQKAEFHAPVATPLPQPTSDPYVYMANATAMSNVVSDNEVKVCGGGRSGSCWVVTVTPMATGR